MCNKKLLALVGAAVLSVVLTGCGSDKDLFKPEPTPTVRNLFNPQPVWSAKTQGVGEFYSQLGPTLFGRKLYIAGRDGYVYCMDGSNGEQQWRVDLSDESENDLARSTRLSGGVTATANFVAVGSENGYLYILRAEDGSVYFKLDIGAEILTKPVFSESGDKIFVLDGFGQLHGIDLVKKEKIWTSGDNSSQLHLRSQARPIVIGNEMVIVGLPTGHIMMVSQESGYVLNQVTVGQGFGANDIDRIADVSSTPLLLGSNMYSTAYNGGFVKYSLAEHSIVSRLGYHSSKDIAYDDLFFVITGDNGHIYCVRRDNNVEVWANTELTYRNVTAPTIYGNFVVVGDYEGYVYFINLNTGKIASKIQIGEEPIYLAPIVVGNCIVIYSSNGSVNVYCYDPSGIVIAKKRYNDLEMVTGNTAALIAADALDSNFGASGITQEQLEERRAQARKLVAQIEASEREAERRYREYLQQKAEYERKVKEYEEEKRKALSGFGLAPEAGIKSDEDEYELIVEE